MRTGCQPRRGGGIDSAPDAEYVLRVAVTAGESSAVGVRWDLSLIFADAAEARSVLAAAVARAWTLEEQVAGIGLLDDEVAVAEGVPFRELHRATVTRRLLRDIF